MAAHRTAEPGAADEPGAPGAFVAQMLDAIADAVIVRSPDGAVVYWSAAAEALYGWSRGDVLGADADAILNSRPTFSALSGGAGNAAAADVSRVAADGRVLLVEAQFRPMLDADGTVRHIVETARDVTAERAARRASEAAETRYRNLFNTMTAAFFELDITQSLRILGQISAATEGDVRALVLERDDLFERLIETATITHANERVFDLFGYRAPEDIRTPAPIWTRESRPAFLDILLARARGVQRITSEIHLRTRSGGDLFGILTACHSSAGMDEGRVMLGVVDTTELKRANDAVERGREHHRVLFHHMPIALCRINSDALVAFYQTLPHDPDIPAEVFIERNPSFMEAVRTLCFIEEANPEAIALLGARDAQDLVGRPIGFAWKRRPDSLARLVATGLRRTHCRMETRLERLDGKPVDVLFASAMIQAEGSRSSVIGMIDIGERLRAQDAFGRLQSEFAHASRISLLGELSASIAHEISQPLAAIATTGTTGLRWLGHAQPRLDEVRSSLEKIVGYAQRATKIIARVRQMASGRTPVMTVEVLNDVVAGAVQLIEAQARAHRIRIALDPDPEAGRVSIDRTQIEQVVVNLVVNAIQAIAEAGSEARTIAIDIAVREGHAQCRVADSGPGIAPEQATRVFERFVSSKAEGTGLGLALCRSILQAHGGEIFVDGHSELGGARFRFELPLAQD